MKFHDDRCKGKAVMRRKQKCGRTDGRTDGHGDSSIHPPNFVAGGIIKLYRCIKYRQNGIFKTAMATSHVRDKIADVPTKCRQMMYHVHNGSFKYGVNSSAFSMGSLHVKFHDDRCNGKAVMRRKPFSVIYAL